MSVYLLKRVKGKSANVKILAVYSSLRKAINQIRRIETSEDEKNLISYSVITYEVK